MFWRRQKSLFPVAIRKPDHPTRILAAILAITPTPYNGLSLGKSRIAEENLTLGFVFTDCLSKRVYINSTVRPMCMLDRLLLLK